MFSSFSSYFDHELSELSELFATHSNYIYDEFHEKNRQRFLLRQQIREIRHLRCIIVKSFCIEYSFHSNHSWSFIHAKVVFLTLNCRQAHFTTIFALAVSRPFAACRIYSPGAMSAGMRKSPSRRKLCEAASLPPAL